MNLIERLERIENAVSAIELRDKFAITCIFSSENSCRVHYRKSKFIVPRVLCAQLMSDIEALVHIQNGFMGLVKDSRNLAEYFSEHATQISTDREEWNTWIQNLGQVEVSYYDAMKLIALQAVSVVDAD
ncbi:hypothetical protein [Desulfomonile tiedjei]|uniref:Uncharacterized protein n=1 Tax=Desulfomonile tiedjei (strain ATCC 49306 / DSM 6799 / DCB-1) TaxID=706587 RepID=I4CC24_DESTA|nr:hypothetical protein [Desulfomonile tiedjei]AFM27115.1 hypothetical protein Desti_4483 [Desulfomonile tiedjei DSM 6799]